MPAKASAAKGKANTVRAPAAPAVRATTKAKAKEASAPKVATSKASAAARPARLGKSEAVAAAAAHQRGKAKRTASASASRNAKPKKADPRAAVKAHKGARLNHPTYKEMTLRALDTFPASTNASKMGLVKIGDILASNYTVSAHFRHYIKTALQDLMTTQHVAKHGHNQYVLTLEGRLAARRKTKKRTGSAVKKAAKPALKRAAAKKAPAKKAPVKKASAGNRKKPIAAAARKKVPVAIKAAVSRKSAKGDSRSSAAGKSSLSALAAAAALNRPITAKHGLTLARGFGSTTMSVNVAGSKYDFFWQYRDDTRGGWCNYDVTASDVCEKVYQGYLANRGDTDVRAVKSGSWEYMVDFAAMKQTNLQHEAHTVRDIRRVKNTAGKDE